MGSHWPSTTAARAWGPLIRVCRWICAFALCCGTRARQFMQSCQILLRAAAFGRHNRIGSGWRSTLPCIQQHGWDGLLNVLRLASSGGTERRSCVCQPLRCAVPGGPNFKCALSHTSSCRPKRRIHCCNSCDGLQLRWWAMSVDCQLVQYAPSWWPSRFTCSAPCCCPGLCNGCIIARQTVQRVHSSAYIAWHGHCCCAGCGGKSSSCCLSKSAGSARVPQADQVPHDGCGCNARLQRIPGHGLACCCSEREQLWEEEPSGDAARQCSVWRRWTAESESWTRHLHIQIHPRR